MTAGPYNGNQITLVIVVSVCFVLSTLSVALRFFTRRLTRASLGWDDWSVLLALVFSWVTNIFTIISIRAGLGKHIAELTNDDILLFGLSFWIQELTWTVAICLIILSILMFYNRLFPVKTWLRRSVYAISIFTLCWTISTFLTLVFQCTPVPYFWNRTIPGGHCIQASKFYFINGTISMLTVFIVLCLPTPILWKLQVSNAKRLGLIFSFTVGSFVCAMSVARLIAIRRINNEDLPWTSVFPGMWSCVETNIGVLSACLPSLTPLFRIAAGNGPNGNHPSVQLNSNDLESKRSRGATARTGPTTTPDLRSESLEGILVTDDIMVTSIRKVEGQGFELREFQK